MNEKLIFLYRLILLLSLVGSSFMLGHMYGYDAGYFDGGLDEYLQVSEYDIPPIDKWNHNYQNKFIYANYSWYLNQNIHLFDTMVGFGPQLTVLNIDFNKTDENLKQLVYLLAEDDYLGDLENMTLNKENLELFILDWVEDGQSLFNGTSSYIHHVDDVNVHHIEYTQNGEDIAYWRFTEEESTEYWRYYYNDDGLLLEINMLGDRAGITVDLIGSVSS